MDVTCCELQFFRMFMVIWSLWRVFSPKFPERVLAKLSVSEMLQLRGRSRGKPCYD
jgi:hypothetical protein